MKKCMERLEALQELGGIRKDVTLLAISGVGSDIAVDAADIALVDNEIRELPHLVALSKRMRKTIKLNMTFSMTLNFIAIVLAMTGTRSPRRRRAGSQRRFGACDYKFRILTELRSKKARPFLKSLHFDCAQNFCPDGAKILHLRGEMYFSGRKPPPDKMNFQFFAICGWRNSAR